MNAYPREASSSQVPAATAAQAPTRIKLSRSFRRNGTFKLFGSICMLASLTIDMSGGQQQAKPDGARPLDGWVRHHSVLRTA